MPKKEDKKAEYCEVCKACINDCKYELPAMVQYCPKFKKKPREKKV